MKVKVSNMESPRTGHEVANQFIIEVDGCVFFQSYQTLIAKKCKGEITISEDWSYSRTTAKYFYEFLRTYGYFTINGKKDVEELIEKGTLKVVESL